MGDPKTPQYNIGVTFTWTTSMQGHWNNYTRRVGLYNETIMIVKMLQVPIQRFQHQTPSKKKL